MANFNKIFLMGNLTRDPQLSYTPNQTAVVEFGLAVNRRWTGRDGEKREETCFVDCQAFGRSAENINKYLSKGRPLFVEGRLTFNSWTAQDGTKRSKHRVTVENFQFLGTASDAGPVKQSTGGDVGAGSQVEGNRFANNSQMGPGAKRQDNLDDIPF